MIRTRATPGADVEALQPVATSIAIQTIKLRYVEARAECADLRSRYGEDQLRGADGPHQDGALRQPRGLSHPGNLMELFTGPDNYNLIHVPPLVWNGFKGIGTEPALVANCATVGHSKDEIVRMDPFSKEIPYNWSLRHG